MPLVLALASCFSPQGGGSMGTSTTGPPAETSTAVSTPGGETTVSETAGIPTTTGTTDEQTGAVTTTGTTETTSSTSTTNDTGTTAVGVCGDGMIDAPPEQCDDGADNDMDAPCTPACQNNVCGDGFFCPACDEECDDGNQVEGDGCSSQCMQEHLFIFVTSIPKIGKEIEGVAGADLFCQQLAAGKFHPSRKFVAWMTTDMPMANRIGKATLPYVAPVSFTKIATGIEGLVTSKLEAPILTTELGAMLVPTNDCTKDSSVWTGVAGGGIPDANNCTNWSAEGTGLVGSLGAMDNKWTEACSLNCALASPLYCVETIL